MMVAILYMLPASVFILTVLILFTQMVGKEGWFFLAFCTLLAVAAAWSIYLFHHGLVRLMEVLQ